MTTTRSVACLLILMCATAALAGCTGQSEDEPVAANGETEDEPASANHETDEASLDENPTTEPAPDTPPPPPPAPEPPPSPVEPPTCRISSTQNGVPTGPGLVAVSLLNWTPELVVGDTGNTTFDVPADAWAVTFALNRTNFVGMYNFTAYDDEVELWTTTGTGSQLTVNIESGDSEPQNLTGAFGEIPPPGTYTLEFLLVGAAANVSFSLYAHVCDE